MLFIRGSASNHCDRSTVESKVVKPDTTHQSIHPLVERYLSLGQEMVSTVYQLNNQAGDRPKGNLDEIVVVAGNCDKNCHLLLSILICIV